MDLCKQAQLLWHDYILLRTPEALGRAMAQLADDCVIIGTGKHEFYLSRAGMEQALAALERAGKLKAVITQNIDGLHQQAGSKEVLELHGSVNRNRCLNCHAFMDLDTLMAHRDEQGIPRCAECGGLMKPEVVLYGEGLDMEVMQRSVDHIANADLLIVGGTSLVVYPAAGLLRYFRGSHLVLINRDRTEMDHLAELVIHEPIGQVLKEWAE